MKIDRLVSVTFSPAFHTKAVQSALAALLPYPCQSFDITPYAARHQTMKLCPEDLLLVGAPVYAGRIPAPAAERLSQLRGEGNPAILLATYGNRAVEDALIEMGDILQAQGFLVLGAAAVVAEHSIVKGYAANRPDERDNAEMAAFARACADKIDRLEKGRGSIRLPGNRPYRESKGHSIPIADENCIECGLCARECPVAAIHTENLKAGGEAALCFGCMRCCWVCPKEARNIPAADVQRIRAFLEGIPPARKDNCFFV